MARRLNVVLQQRIRSVADQVLSDDPLTTCVARAVTDRVWKTDFLGKTYNQAYQMVCYYLRGIRAYIKAQPRYTEKELSNLVIAKKAAISEFALARGVTPGSVEQAVSRYKERQSSLPTPLSGPWFNFSRRADLDARGFSLEDVAACRDYLDENCGLALRAPNILYHPKTKRRYAMSDTEQVAILMDPKKYLQTRSAHIKEHWVVRELDPMYEPEDADTIDLATTTAAEKRLAERVRRLSAAIKESPPKNQNSLLYAALSKHVNFCLTMLQCVDARTSKETTND